MHFSAEKIIPAIKAALDEDIGAGDVTTDSTIPETLLLDGTLTAKESGVIAGLEVARQVFKMIDSRVVFNSKIEDGTQVTKGTPIANISGPGRAILKGERTALNFLQRMSGIATLTNRFVDAVKGTKAVILDTRKTAPGLRLVDKWAVKSGGGQNHRIGLFDMVMIKDNHISAGGGITRAVELVRAKRNSSVKIEVEVKNLNELEEAISLKVDRILLDNMPPEIMQNAVKITDRRIPLEASGNVSLHNAAEIAATGVDFISIGVLTHSVKALDVSMLINLNEKTGD